VGDVVDFLFKESKINTRSVGKIVLSGHSGGYEGIAFALMRGGIPEKVREVYLFDALYAETEKFTHWIDRFNGKLINIYTDSGGTTWDTRAMMDDLSGWGIAYFAKDELAVSPLDLQTNRLIFIHTDLGHDQVMSARAQFREYLKASCFSNR